jgi:hypothetical protein
VAPAVTDAFKGHGHPLPPLEHRSTMKRLLFTSVGKVPTSIPGRRRDAARVTVERLSKMDQTGYFRYFARRLITANIFSFR